MKTFPVLTTAFGSSIRPGNDEDGRIAAFTGQSGEELNLAGGFPGFKKLLRLSRGIAAAQVATRAI